MPGRVMVEGTPVEIRANEQTIVEGLVQTVKDVANSVMGVPVVESNLGAEPLPDAA
jgi:hypothetical protein